MRKNKKRVLAGRANARKRWAKLGRYDALVELTKFYGKDFQDQFIKWPTEYLVKLAGWHRKNK